MIFGAISWVNSNCIPFALMISEDGASTLSFTSIYFIIVDDTFFQRFNIAFHSILNVVGIRFDTITISRISKNINLLKLDQIVIEFNVTFTNYGFLEETDCKILSDIAFFILLWLFFLIMTERRSSYFGNFNSSKLFNWSIRIRKKFQILVSSVMFYVMIASGNNVMCNEKCSSLIKVPIVSLLVKFW